jgi:hypothetical protein
MNKSFHTIIPQAQVDQMNLDGIEMTARPLKDYPRLCRVEFSHIPNSGVERPKAWWDFYQELEDGFIKLETELRYHKGMWYLEKNHESRSCDGPLYRYDEWESEGGLEEGCRESTIKSVKSRQRDVFAERMGY